MKDWMIPLAPGMLYAIAFLIFVDGGIRDQLRKRLVKPKPLVALIADMLLVQSGWTCRYGAFEHETGVTIKQRYSDYFRLFVDGSDVQLSHADRHCLKMAVDGFEKRRKSENEEKAAAMLAERAQAFAEKVQNYADNVVAMRGRK